MWFKQIQLFEIPNTVPKTAESLTEKLEQLLFVPCLPAVHQSLGWVTPTDVEDATLICSYNHYFMYCLQIEEKILPASVIRQEVNEAIKELETSQNRKLRQKEKYDLKDEITMLLLPKAFSKRSQVYAYHDMQNKWLVLGTSNSKRTDQFLSLFKKTISDDIHYVQAKNLSSIMTNWLKNQSHPSSFAIEKTCVLQDPNQENRIIRCKQQDLFAPAIQSLIKDGCEIIQLGLTWEDRVSFVLNKDFSLSNIQFHDEVIEQSKELEPETKQQQFNADFLIMTETLAKLLPELCSVINVKNRPDETPMRIAV